MLAFRYELTSLSPKTAQAAGGQMNRLFNAGLTIADNAAVSQPQLAESVPQLNTASWQVLPNGEMLTDYRLRAGLSWHDGKPLTASDFVFARQVYAEPQLAFTIGVFLLVVLHRDNADDPVAADDRNADRR